MDELIAVSLHFDYSQVKLINCYKLFILFSYTGNVIML